MNAAADRILFIAGTIQVATDSTRLASASIRSAAATICFPALTIRNASERIDGVTDSICTAAGTIVFAADSIDLIADSICFVLETIHRIAPTIVSVTDPRRFAPNSIGLATPQICFPAPHICRAAKHICKALPQVQRIQRVGAIAEKAHLQSRSADVLCDPEDCHWHAANRSYGGSNLPGHEALCASGWAHLLCDGSDRICASVDLLRAGANWLGSSPHVIRRSASFPGVKHNPPQAKANLHCRGSILPPGTNELFCGEADLLRRKDNRRRGAVDHVRYNTNHQPLTTKEKKNVSTHSNPAEL